MHRRASRCTRRFNRCSRGGTGSEQTRFFEQFLVVFRLLVLRAMSSRLYKRRSRPIQSQDNSQSNFSIQLCFLPYFLRFAITFSFFIVFSIRLHQELHKFVVIIANLCPNVAWAGHGPTTPEPPRSPRVSVRINSGFSGCVRPRIRSCANTFYGFGSWFPRKTPTCLPICHPACCYIKWTTCH